MNVKSFGYTSLALAILVSSVMPLAYSLANNTNPVQLAFFAALIGTAGSLILMLAKGTQTNLPEQLKGKSLFQFVFVGATYAALMLIFAYTTHFISAALLAVVYRSWPLMLVLAAPFLLHERITKYGAVAVAIGFAGMAAAFFSGTVFSVPLSMLPFAALVLFGAAMDAVASAFQRGYKYEITSSLFLYNLFTLAAIVLFLPFAGIHLFSSVSAMDVAVITFIGLVQNIFLTFMFTAAIRTIKIEITANLVILVPFLTILLDYWLLGQAISPAYLLIASSVAVGLLIQRLAPKSSNYASKIAKARGMPDLFDVTSAFANTKNSIVYNYIKANGRVVAFVKKPNNYTTLERYLKEARAFSSKNNRCLLLTNKGDNKARRDELEFIKSIIGNEDEDLVVMAVGNSRDIEAYLSGLHDCMTKSHTPSPPNVKS